MNFFQLNLSQQRAVPMSMFDVNSHRRYRGTGKNAHLAYVTQMQVNEKGEEIATAVPVANATEGTLLKQEWQQLDAKVIDVARRRLRFVQMLEASGCTINLASGLGVTEYEWQTMVSNGNPRLTMDGLKQGETNKPVFGLDSIPIPMICDNWNLNLRFLETSRRKGMPMDTTLAGSIALSISDYTENMFINGTGNFTVGGKTLYGLFDTPVALTDTYSAPWDDADTTGQQILNDVNKAIKKANDVHHFGPFKLLLPQKYQAKMGDDFKANGDKTIKQRILELDAISGIEYTEFVTTDKWALLELNVENIAVVNGMDIRNFEQQVLGGWSTEHMVAMIKVPLFRADALGQTGLVIMTQA
jgi:hypothetical protein